MTSNDTLWSFPPALNTTFREAFRSEYHALNSSTEEPGVYSILIAAVHDLTLQERVDSKFRNDGWGGADAVVRVGDTVDGALKGTGDRHYGINCIVCKTGASSGGIENACSNYTDTANVIPYTQRMGPYSTFYIEYFPSLDQYSSIPNETCALCIFTLLDTDDYSVPFYVLQQPGEQRRVFNATNPTGLVLRRIQDPYDVSATSTDQQTPSGSSTNTGLIVGVVVGVLGGTSLLLGLGWLLWRRRKKTKRGESSSNSVSDSAPGGTHRGSRNIALQRIQSLVRRPESSASEVPPPYHEVVRGKKRHLLNLEKAGM